MVDSNDDMLCVKSGADWLGWQAGVPSENVLFEDCEVRSGHGLTLGSEMSGGIRNGEYISHRKKRSHRKSSLIRIAHQPTKCRLHFLKTRFCSGTVQ